ncbi:hypothetical protein PG987_010744 [Apiospora arundinis]
MIGDYAPAEPGKALYVIWARDSEDEKEVRFIDGQLEEIAGPENVYVEKNQDISRKKPPPGRKLYHVECRDRYAEESLLRVADALEGMAGAVNMYTNTSGGGVWYWDAFLTDADVEQVLRMEETCNVFAYKPTDETGHEYDPTDC